MASDLKLDATIKQAKSYFWRGYMSALGKRAALDVRTPADRYVQDPVARAAETLHKAIADIKPIWLADIEAGKGE